MKGAPPPAKTASPDLKTIPGLISTLMSPMPSVRFIACQKLREHGAEAAKVLAKLAREGEYLSEPPKSHTESAMRGRGRNVPMERARALWVLFGMGDLGREAILAALKDTDPRIRALGVRMLREEATKNLDALLPMAGDASPEVRLEVTIALRDIPTEKCRSALLQLARALDPRDRWGTQAASSKTNEPQTTQEDKWYPPTLAATLRNREPDLVKELFVGIESPADEARALVIAWQLQRAEAVPFLAHVLKEPKAPEHFNAALEALGWIDDVSAGEAVAGVAAADPNPGHCRAALDALSPKDRHQLAGGREEAGIRAVVRKGAEGSHAAVADAGADRGRAGPVVRANGAEADRSAGAG